MSSVAPMAPVAASPAPPTPAAGALSTTCPLCHTPGPTLADVGEGMNWRCSVCHQAWDMKRLATVAAYAAFIAERGARLTGAKIK